MKLKRISDFSINEQSAVEIEIQNIDKEISKADLAVSYLRDRVNKKEIAESESLRQQAIELQKKVAALQKKSVAVKKMEDIEKQKTKK